MQINTISIGSWALSIILGAKAMSLWDDYQRTAYYLSFLCVLLIAFGFLFPRFPLKDYGLLARTVITLCIISIISCVLIVIFTADKKELVINNHSIRVFMYTTQDKKIRAIQLRAATDVPDSLKVDVLVSSLGDDFLEKHISKGRSNDNSGIFGGQNTYSFYPPLDIPSKHSFVAVFIQGKKIKGGVTSCVSATTTYGESDWFDPLASIAAIDQNNKELRHDETHIKSFLNKKLERYANTFGRSKDRCFLG